MARNGSLVVVALCVLVTQVSPAQAQQSSEIFEASDGWNAASRAVDDLRHDASNASSAPQLVNKPGFPPSLPQWNAAKARSPAQARAFQPCADLLLRAIDVLRASPDTKRATALIYQADACIAKANRDGDPDTEKKIQDAALAQKPRRNEDLYGGNSTGDPNATAGNGRTPSANASRPGAYNSISRSGCPYPPDIDPNNMSPLAPADARIYDAENAFHQRVLLCEQQRGDLVPGGCASVCMGGDGSKGMTFKPTPPTRITPAAIANLTRSVDRCFAASDPEYRGPDWSKFKGASQLARGEGRIELSFLATGFAATQAMSRFEQRRGKKLPDPDLFRAEIIGWITRCLVDGKLLPAQEDRPLYSQFQLAHESAKVQNSTRAFELMNRFGSGYRFYPSLYPMEPENDPF